MQLYQQKYASANSEIYFIKVNEQNGLGSIQCINTGGIFLMQSVTKVLLLFLQL